MELVKFDTQLMQDAAISGVAYQHGKRQGVHRGRVLERATGTFDIQAATGRQVGISHRWCCPIHRNDGYAYVG